MKQVLIAGLMILLAGCARPQPMLAHGKPVSYWVEALQRADAHERKKAVQVLGNVGPADPVFIVRKTAEGCALWRNPPESI